MKTNLNVDTQALREKILDLAMRGKLVKQDAGDEPASVLLEKIKAEKAELVKEGKIKKSKKLPEITDDEKPFEIPDSWEWVRLGDVLDVRDGTHDTPKYITEGVPLITSKNIRNGYLSFEDVNYISEEDSQKIDQRSKVDRGDIIFAMIGSIGNPVIINTDIRFCIKNVALLKHFTNLIDMNYVLQCMHILQTRFNENASGAVQKFISLRKIREQVMPYPPLAEQKRIADKVYELFKQVDIIEKNVAEYQDLEKAMRSKLLDLAMRGKLVDQDPSDEPASELLKQIQAEKAELVKEGKIKKSKKLPEITDDEKPFDIPDSWEWVRLGDIGDWGAGATPLKSNHEYYKDGTIPWILTGDLNDGHISSANQYITEKALNETSVKIKPVGSVLIAMYGATIGKLGILDIEATTNQACCACVTYSGVSNMYLFNYLMFMKPKFIKSGVGGAQPNISRTKIVATPIPIPPLAEQERIVEKLSQLFEQLETVKQNLTTVS